MHKLNMSRRSFLRTSAVLAAASATAFAANETAFAKLDADIPKEGAKKIRSHCRACGKMECPTWVWVENGRVVNISGDETSPASRGNLCSKGKDAIQALYHPNRIKYPMKRTRPKGEDPGWERISWDEAIKAGADGFNQVIEKYGANSIKVQHGTGRMSTHGVFAFPMVIHSANGGTTAGQVCKGPRSAATSVTAFPSWWTSQRDNMDTFVQWGTNNEISNYDNAGRVVVDNFTQSKHSVCIGPRLQNLGKEADLWIDLRPGTDDFLALAILNLIVNEKKCYDVEFVKRWSNGPFLYSKDIEPSGWTWSTRYDIGTYPLNISTRLVKESDIKEGGSVQRFLIWDNASGSLKWWDAEKCLWEGEEEYQKPTKTTEVKGGVLPEDDGIPNGIDPALDGEYEITLKDGRTITARPIMAMFSDFLKEWTPERVADICWVAPEKITQFVDIYGADLMAGGISFQLAFEHAGNAFQSSRAIYLITSLMGNVDTPGGNRGLEEIDFMYNLKFQYFAPFGAKPFKPEEYDYMAGVDKYPLLPWVFQQGAAALWADMTSSTEMILTGEPYPIVSMITCTGNHFHAGNANENWKAFTQLQFTWGSELWFSPAAELCDVITPAAHFLEVGFLRGASNSEGTLGCQLRVVEPLGEARWDSAVIPQLCKEMGYPYWPVSKEAAPPWWPDELLDTQWPSEEQMLDIQVLPMKMGISTPGPDGDRIHAESWQDLCDQYQEHSVWDLKKYSPFGYYRRYMYGYLRPDNLPGFPTPTGKFEIWSTILESYHPGEEFPVAREPYASPYSTPDLYKEYPIILTSGRRSPLFFHSEGRQQPWLRENNLVPVFQINPQTAAELGIEKGDWCWIESPQGKVREVCDTFEGIRPGVIEADHGWWYPELSAPKHGYDLSNINCLVDQHAQDPIIGATTLRAYLVKIYKATPENSPFGDPVPCDDDGTEIITSADDPRLKAWMPVYDMDDDE